MIDSDDVGDGFLFGGVIVGLIFLVIYIAFSRPEIKACEQNGGAMVKSNGDMICIDKKALVAKEKK
ncbi:hypothetical protein [Herbaspirillum sp. CAH-3]|uniref:hypothetical protein n=1 Tax=Herbaspirillum sp. CAH-3 TaxID=2605746 RepID=UPI0012AC95CC|nr:hypothetical protein [Herbaspirillum sp. CAH-3]MRT30782.1 hypothetical protein [Herbaspirillum sp. CAH-3]